MIVVDLLFELLRYALKQQPLSEQTLNGIPQEDLKKLYSLSKRHDIAHLVAYALTSNNLLEKPSEAYDAFIHQERLSIFRYENINHQLHIVSDLFEKNGVEQVFVLDPTFNKNKQRAKQILQLIQAKAPDIHFTFEVIKTVASDREFLGDPLCSYDIEVVNIRRGGERCTVRLDRFGDRSVIVNEYSVCVKLVYGVARVGFVSYGKLDISLATHVVVFEYDVGSDLIVRAEIGSVIDYGISGGVDFKTKISTASIVVASENGGGAANACGHKQFRLYCSRDLCKIVVYYKRI